MEDLERVLVRLIGVDGVRSILNVYLVGSRLFGTARRSSDYDLIIVCEGPAGGAQKHTAVRERAAAGRAQRRWGACGGSRTLPRTLSCTYGVSKPTGLNPFSFSCSQCTPFQVAHYGLSCLLQIENGVLMTNAIIIAQLRLPPLWVGCN